MPRTLILGYGNPLRGDDALGWVVAEELERRFADDEQVDVMAVHQLTPDLSELLHRYREVVLVDACAGCESTSVVREDVRPDPTPPRPFTHYVTPGQLLASTRALYGSAPKVVFVGLTTNAFEVGKPLSRQVRAALPRLVDVVARQVGLTDARLPRRRARGSSR